MSTQPQLSRPGAAAHEIEPLSRSGVEGVEPGSAQSAPTALVRDPAIVRLPVQIDIAVPIRNLRVADLLALAEGQLLSAQWSQGEDVPMMTRGAQLAWAEFESLETKLAVRITRLV